MCWHLRQTPSWLSAQSHCYQNKCKRAFRAKLGESKAWRSFIQTCSPLRGFVQIGALRTWQDTRVVPKLLWVPDRRWNVVHRYAYRFLWWQKAKLSLTSPGIRDSSRIKTKCSWLFMAKDSADRSPFFCTFVPQHKMMSQAGGIILSSYLWLSRMQRLIYLIY